MREDVNHLAFGNKTHPIPEEEGERPFMLFALAAIHAYTHTHTHTHAHTVPGSIAMETCH